MRFDDGYWERDSYGNYHWVDYGYSGLGFLIVIGMMFMDNMSYKIYNFLSYPRVLVIALILTGIFFLVNRCQKVCFHFLYFIQFVMAILMIKFISEEYVMYANVGLSGIFDELVGTFVIGLVTFIVYKIAFRYMLFSTWDYNIKDTLIGLLVQFIGTGIFAFFNVLGII